jgi:cysteine sulfinate desulfinase/cysteine desulfurase-like protein
VPILQDKIRLPCRRLVQEDGRQNQNGVRGAEMSLYKNIAKKRARIKAGSKEKMRKPGSKGAPTAAAFKKAAKTAKKPAKKKAKK